MAEKIFMERDGVVLRGDARDFMLPVQHTIAVLAWCRRNQIDVEFPLTQYSRVAREHFGVKIWRIRDEQQRMWFALRWA